MQRGWVLGFVLSAFIVSSAGPSRGGINVWTSQGPAGGVLSWLAIDPQHPGTLYAGTGLRDVGPAGAGVFKSTDGGASWNAVNNGLGNTNVLALVLDPAAPATLYTGTDGSGVFK